MKRIIPTKDPLLGAALWGAMLLAGVSTQAADIYQTANQTLGINWNTGVSWGTPAAVAAAGNNYISGGTGTFVVRTLDASTNSPTLSTFVGNKLTLTNNGAGGAIGSLVLNNGGGFAGLATANIEMAGGTISYNTANQSTTDWRAALGGTISVTRDSTFNAISSIQFNRDILLLANLSGTGNLTVAMVTNSLVLLGTNTAFSGNWTNTTGYIEIGSDALDPLGPGIVTLVNSTNALRFNATNNLVLNNVIQGLGGVAKLNSGTLTLGGNNTYTGSTAITNGVLKLVTPISSSTNIILAGGTLDATSLSGGGLALNAANFQSLKCNGSVTGNLTVNAANPLNFTVTSTTNDILNVSGSLTLSGTPVTLNVKVPTFKAAGTYRLINYTGAAIPTSSFNLVLDGVTSQTYVLSTTANQVNLVVVGVPKSLTWLGVSGDWDTTSLNWTNSGGLTATNFADGDSVTFDDSAASFLVYVNNSSFNVIPNSVVVSNVSNPYTIYGDGISTAGKLTKQGAADLTFTSPSNNFTGTIDIQAGVLSIGAGGGFGALGAPTAITNNGTFRLNLSSGGIAVNAPISGSGAVEVLGASTLTLNGTNSYTGFTTINDGCQLFVSKPNGLGTTDSGTRVLAGGKFGVNFGGTVEVAEPMFVNGAGILSSPGALYAINGNTRVNFTGPVVVETSSRFRMVSNPVFMTFSNTVTGTDVELWCTTGNTAAESADTITFASSLTLGSGGSFFKDGSGVVNLDSAINTWGSTLITNGTLAANNVLNGGTVTVTGGALGGSGTVNGAVD
ncbi:MAG: beta strand repeat-containing protein, partial [Verrucomicrobiota bacterium]